MFRMGQGNAHFLRSRSLEDQRFFQSLEKGQSPEALLFTCCDSRVVPSIFTETKPGELFVDRTIGNIIHPAPTDAPVAATIEYALKVLKIKEIIVCGHTECGAMQGLINPRLVEDLPATRQLLRIAAPVLEKIGEIPNPRERLQRAIEENVLLQLEHLKSHPAVGEALSEDSIKIHGCVYNIGTGELQIYDEHHKTFTPVETWEMYKDCSSSASFDVGSRHG
ncbi:carbonic anhydrase [Legionella impletisoli]|uniref:Carbonic anhydrase n=1 Tax=Legionella impletisoli TaxID=343510 RepID=A0A917JP14_9GAMM|nr:carbonic anhydrase [Legionella impletisoli]GGI77741.1 carbonic anhydrase [Legionella impletisoli]